MNRIEGDLLVTKSVQCGSIKLPANAVGDAVFNTADPLTAEKAEHQYMPGYSQPSGSAVTSYTGPLFVARAAGTVEEFRAGSIVACVGVATITVDLRKNGTTILTSVITLDNANTARIFEDATITTAAYVAGDWFDIVVTATAGGGTLGQGLFVQGVFREGSG
jgi:hypothetical protein